MIIKSTDFRWKEVILDNSYAKMLYNEGNKIVLLQKTHGLFFIPILKEKPCVKIFDGNEEFELEREFGKELAQKITDTVLGNFPEEKLNELMEKEYKRKYSKK